MNQIRQIAWLAVLWGVLTDFVLSEIMWSIVGLNIGIDPSTDSSAATEMLRASALFWPATALGILFTGLGGFVAGRLAGRGGVFYGTLVAFISNVVLGMLLNLQPLDDVQTAAILLCFAAGMIGGWLGALSSGQRKVEK